MKFVTIADLSRTIRANFAKIPHDVDFVVGVPRSGILAASIIAEWLNVGLVDSDNFCGGAKPTGGRRLAYHTPSKEARPKVLVVDDTIYGGGSMRRTRQMLRPFAARYEFIYCAVYLEGPCGDVDIWLEDLRGQLSTDCPYALYEWNIFHHTLRISGRCLYDMDGVLCVEPPDERDTAAYERYLPEAVPLFVPTNEIGGIVSYRLRKYEAVTRAWLEGHGIRYATLTMYDAASYEERRAGYESPAHYKAEAYRQHPDALLFIESSDHQAREIARLTGRSVYCVESNKMY